MLTKEEVSDIESNINLLRLVINNSKERVDPSNDYAKKIIPISERLTGKKACESCPDKVRDAFVIVNKVYKEWKISQDTNLNTGGSDM